MRISYCSGVGGWFQEVPPEIIDHKKDAESSRRIAEALRAIDDNPRPPLPEEPKEYPPPEKKPHIGCYIKSFTGQELEIWENEDGSFCIKSSCVESVSIFDKEHTEKIPEDIRKLRFDGPPLKEEIPTEITRKWKEIHIATKCGDPDANMCGD